MKWLFDYFSVFSFFFLLLLPVLVSILVYIFYTTKKGQTMTFIRHRQVQALSFGGHSIKSRVVSDGNQSVHTCGCYTCMQSFIDSIFWRKQVLDSSWRRIIIPIPKFYLPWNPRPLLLILYFVHHIISYCGCLCVKQS